MIEMADITKSFGPASNRVQILRGISLFISKGEFVSIMGPSGSGKSTLSSILGCLARPTSGVYKLDGQDLNRMSSHQLARLRNRHIGFIFQDYNLLDGLSIAENVALPLFYAGVGPRERHQRAVASLKKVGLEHKKDNMPNQLSGGQKQRVAIARALVSEPTFLFADEPTGALDKRTGHEIMGLIQRLNLMGHTVVQVTHSPADANYSKRILYLVDGLIVKDELVEKPTLGAVHEAGGNDPTNELQSRFWKIAQTCPAVSPENLKVLLDLLGQSVTQDSLVEAVRALIRWEGKTAEDAIQKLFEHEFWPVRAEVLRVCTVRPRDFFLPFCFSALNDTNAWVRFLAILNIKKNSPLPLSDDRKALIAEKVRDPDERVRATAVVILGQMKEARYLSFVLEALEDRDGRVRANAIETLAIFLKDSPNQGELARSIKNHLDDRNNRARANAAVVLFPYEADPAMEALTKMVNSENNLMRASAAWGLGCLADERGHKLLIEVLQREKDELVLGQVIRSLSRLSRDILSLGTQFQILFGNHTVEALAA